MMSEGRCRMADGADRYQVLSYLWFLSYFFKKKGKIIAEKIGIGLKILYLCIIPRISDDG